MPREACAPRRPSLPGGPASGGSCLERTAVCQDLRSAEIPCPQSSDERRRDASTKSLPLRPQDEVECRRCGVHCDKVVYPAACIDRACPFVYAYEEFGHTYIGCMQKVYEVEIDVDLLREAEARRGGFGAVRSVRQPLPMCRVEVEETYRTPRRRPRLREPRVLGAAGRAADLPGLRAASLALTRAEPRAPFSDRPLRPVAASTPPLRFAQRAWSSRSFRISPASGPWLSGPGTSSTAGSPWSAGCAEEGAEPLADQPLADVRVPVAVRAERRLRVVDVQSARRRSRPIRRVDSPSSRSSRARSVTS